MAGVKAWNASPSSLIKTNSFDQVELNPGFIFGVETKQGYEPIMFTVQDPCTDLVQNTLIQFKETNVKTLPLKYGGTVRTDVYEEQFAYTFEEQYEVVNIEKIVDHYETSPNPEYPHCSSNPTIEKPVYRDVEYRTMHKHNVCAKLDNGCGLMGNRKEIRVMKPSCGVVSCKEWKGKKNNYPAIAAQSACCKVLGVEKD
jgi:hypothetical protein